MIKWFGTIAGIIGSLLVAANAGWQWLGYAAFLSGSLAWLKVSIAGKDGAGMLQWVFFSAVNLWGFINYVR